MTETISVTRNDWTFIWHGGRLADIYHSGKCIDCVQVGSYDFVQGKLLVPFTVRSLNKAADKWMRNSAADYERELPYLL